MYVHENQSLDWLDYNSVCSACHLDGFAFHLDGFDNHIDVIAFHLVNFAHHLDGSASHLDEFAFHLDDIARHLDRFASHLDYFAYYSNDIYCLQDRFDILLENINYKIDRSEQAPALIPSRQGTCHKHTGNTRNPNLWQEPCQPSHATAPINGSTSIKSFNAD
jgi:hypothetical protein